MSLRRTLYSVLLYLILPLVILRLFWRSRTNPSYRKRISERFGFVNIKSKKKVIWAHAVSVGEVIAAQPLINALIQQYPDNTILVTTTTPTGSDRVKAIFGNSVEHVYFPYDLPCVISRFLKHVKPITLIVIETEIWPNLYSKCGSNNIPLLLVNARLSDRSTYRYSKIKTLVAETIENISCIAVRSSIDAERFVKLGADKNKISIVGNIKFDISLDSDQLALGRSWRQSWNNTNLVWVAASTHIGEDEKVLEIHQNLLNRFPNLLLVLVPRHPERFDDVYALCEKYEQMNVVRHSLVDNYEKKETKLILGDSMGEMQCWFATADVVFIGGSLVEIGGHNPIEPIAQGVPVVSGSYMFNFDDITSELSDEGLLFMCSSKTKLEDKIIMLLNQKMNIEEKAKIFMQQHTGVTARLLKLINKNL